MSDDNEITYFFGVEGITDNLCNNIVFNKEENAVYLHKVKHGVLDNCGEVTNFLNNTLNDVEEDLHLQLESIMLTTLDPVHEEYTYKNNKSFKNREVSLYIKSIDSTLISSYKIKIKFEDLMSNLQDMYDGVELDNKIHTISKRLAYAIVGDYMISVK